MHLLTFHDLIMYLIYLVVYIDHFLQLIGHVNLILFRMKEKIEN